MNNKFQPISTTEQTKKLNELLNMNKSEYILEDIFNLPQDIRYNNRRGYFSVGLVGIEYTSTNYNGAIDVITYSSLIPKTSIYDCLIEMVEWFINYKDKIELVDTNIKETILKNIYE